LNRTVYQATLVHKTRTPLNSFIVFTALWSTYYTVACKFMKPSL